MLPSATLNLGSESPVITDADGRRLALRRLNALDKLRLFKAAGPELTLNQHWLGMAFLASSVIGIDDVPVPPPMNEQQIEAMVARLGDVGIEAVARALQPEPDPMTSLESRSVAGN